MKQSRTDKDKVYSLHKSYTSCIAKGKASVAYEFGNKVGLISTAGSRIIVAAMAFSGNPHDSRTIEPLLRQMKANGIKLPQTPAYDRGGRGRKMIEGVEILTPSKPKSGDTESVRRKKRHAFRRRAAIELLIGHLKHDNRMKQNYLWGASSATINVMLAGAAWNFKKLARELAKKAETYFLSLIFSLFEEKKFSHYTTRQLSFCGS